jgi:DNA polymerase-4
MAGAMTDSRKIIHVDMDAFYASVEQRDRPDLRGKPVIVGGSPNSRGVVAACSYEARKFGIHSAMASARAYKLCPQAVFLKPRFDVYQAVSAQIRAIFYQYTDLVEPLSLDEAFLDVTVNKAGIDSATCIARQILRQIYENTGKLTASAGVSYNKFLAKVASDVNKPNGLCVVTPAKAAGFIDRLPIRKFYGIGKVTEKRMLNLGIRTGADLKKMELNKLLALFGKAGHFFYDISHGRDDRPVVAHWIRKSIGKETTFGTDLDDIDEMLTILKELAEQVERTLRRDKRKGLTLTLKVKYQDFQCITRSLTVSHPLLDAGTLMSYIPGLLENTEAGRRKVRLLGIAVSNFLDEAGGRAKWVQLALPLEDEKDACGEPFS